MPFSFTSQTVLTHFVQAVLRFVVEEMFWDGLRDIDIEDDPRLEDRWLMKPILASHTRDEALIEFQIPFVRSKQFAEFEEDRQEFSPSSPGSFVYKRGEIRALGRPKPHSKSYTLVSGVAMVPGRCLSPATVSRCEMAEDIIPLLGGVASAATNRFFSGISGDSVFPLELADQIDQFFRLDRNGESLPPVQAGRVTEEKEV